MVLPVDLVVLMTSLSNISTHEFMHQAYACLTRLGGLRVDVQLTIINAQATCTNQGFYKPIT